MSPITRGIRNAFRNITRTISIVFILGLSIGLSLVMLVANQAVDTKIKKTLSSIGNVISVQPAGFMGTSSVNNALTTSDVDKLETIPDVKDITSNLVDHVQTEGTTSQPGGTPAPGSKVLGSDDSASTGSTTSLKTPYEIDCEKGTCAGGGISLMIKTPDGSAPKLPANFSTPIDFVGTDNPANAKSINASKLSMVSGKAVDPVKDSNDTMVSSDMANKNNLKVGSTFTAYGNTLTVVGIFDSDTQIGDSSVILSLSAAQRLTKQTDTVTGVTVTADSLENLSSVTSAVKQEMDEKADVTSSQDEASEALAPLKTVKKISSYSLIGSAGAGAIIILLTMIMIVRERKREIGVVKAIGASNLRIVFQFLFEALTLTTLGALVGMGIGLLAGAPVTSTLVSNSTDGVSVSGSGMPIPGLDNIGDIQAAVGWPILLYGFAAALLIAAVGSVLAAGLIAKVRPSEVLRSE